MTRACVALSLFLIAGCNGDGLAGIADGGDAGAKTAHGKDAAPTLLDASVIADLATVGDAALVVPGDLGTRPDLAQPAPVTCQGRNGALGDPFVTLTSGGLLRTSLMHIPKSYDPTQGTMLVLNAHGYSSDGAQESLLTNMNASADFNNFIVGYPYGIANSWNAGQCCGDAWLNAVDDVQFFRDLLDTLEAQYCIDPKRVFMTGMSNGGFMSYRVACEISDRFAAVAPVAGTLGIPPQNCNPVRPVPIMDFHGTADPLVPYDGGVPLIQSNWPGELDFRSVASTISIFRGLQSCAANSVITYQNGDATCQTWAPCDQGSVITQCTIDGGGHTWPGGLPIPIGKTSTDINATDYMVEFFLQHPMP